MSADLNLGVRLRRVGDLLELSSRIIDDGVLDEPVNRVTNELSELADDLAIVESFSHCVALRTDDGLVCFDASGVHTGAAVVESIRRWSPAPIAHARLHARARRSRRRQRVRSPPMPCRRRRAAKGDRPRERRRPPRPLRADERLEPDHQRPSVRRCPVEMNLASGARDGPTVPARRHARAGRDVRAPTRRADRRRAHRTAPRPGRDRRPPVGLAPRPTVGRWSATSSSGTSPTPATRRRCSATPSNGRPRCAR